MPLEPIAIIGLGCRYPGANHPAAFWQLLQAGKDAVTEVPPDRWDIQQFYSPDLREPGKTNTRWGGFLEGIDRFDPQFFGIAPREVASMDPQQRLLLEVAWEALENGGQVPEKLRGSETGVFIGIGTHDYSIMLWQQPVNDPYATMGTGHCIAANRISYLFDFKGPSLAIDTACSSSLVAVHLACQSIWTGESSMALAGGVNALILPTVTIGFSKGGFMSPSGRCQSFDADADGYVRSEGAGVVVLKPLSQAMVDRDPIYAVIRGTAVNQDGFSQGMAAPNPKAQEAVLRSAYRRAGVDPSQVQYVEAHGTGTKLGDPIELQALSAVLTEGRVLSKPCAIGSVKSNIGHTETAAGVAGLIKVALMMKYGQIPPSLHFKTPNPQIPFDRIPLRVQTELSDWSTDLPMLAGVNSFGFGGTNAHVVVEAAPLSSGISDVTELRAAPQPPTSGGLPNPQHPALLQNFPASNNLENFQTSFSTQSPPLMGDLGGCKTFASQPASQIGCTAVSQKDRSLHLFTLSAKTEKALRALSDRFSQFITNHSQINLSDLCYTVNARRSRFSHRLTILTASLPQLQQQLAAFSNHQQIAGVTYSTVGSPAPLAWLFTGQGSQYAGMGRELYETEPVFRETIDRCNDLLKGQIDRSLIDLLYGEDANSINQTAYTQPAIFALEYALAQLWLSWGIKPDAVMGHSVGEYVAACVAGVFSLEDGLKLIAARGRLMQALPLNGGMVSVAADESTVRSIMTSFDPQTVSIAAINGSQSTVISGEQETIDLVAIECELQGIKTTRLKVSHAFHSPLMEPMIAEFRQIASTIAFTPPQKAIVSNVTGNLIGDEIATPEYWCNHIRQPVRFAAGLTTLHQQNYSTFLEIGAKPILCGMGRTCLPSDSKWLPSLDPRQSDWTVLLQSLGAIDSMGIPVKWAAFDRAEERQVLHLPTYPFQRQRYWWDEAMLPGTYEAVPRLKANAERVLASVKDSERSLNPPSLGDFQTSESSRLGFPQNWGARGADHPLLGQFFSSNSSEKLFTASIASYHPTYLQDHQIGNQIIFPAAGYLEIALAAANEINPENEICLEALTIEQPLILSDFETTVQTIVSSDDSFQIWSGEDDRKRHATGKIRSVAELKPSDPSKIYQEIQQVQQREGLTAAGYYQQLRQQHLNYGRSFQAIQQIWQQEHTAWSAIQLPEDLDPSSYCLHPVIWDGCFQTVGAIVSSQPQTYLPVGIDRLIVFGAIDRVPERPLNSPSLGDFEKSSDSPAQGGIERQDSWLGSPQNWGARGAQIWCRAELQSTDLSHAQTNQPRILKANLTLFNPIGETIATIEGLTLQAVSDAALNKLLNIRDKSDKSQKWLYELTWQLQNYHASEQPRADKRQWVIFADDRGTGENLAALLKTEGNSAILIRTGKKYQQIDAEQYAIDPTQPNQLQQLISELSTANSGIPLGVVHLWGLNRPTPEQSKLDTQILGCGTVLNLLQSALPAARLWLITQNTQAIDSTQLEIDQASLWGLARTIRLEHPELNCTCVDLDSQITDATIAQLVKELRQPDDEDQIAYRQGQRYVARLKSFEPQQKSVPSVPFRLGISDYGVLDHLGLTPCDRQPPQKGEVEIQVTASGVNFRDVLNALGMLQPVLEEMGFAEAGAVPFGGECAGRVVAIGSGVRGLKVGDEVIAAQAIGSLGQFVTVKSQFVVLKPKRLTFAEAATVPTTFLTAEYGLRHLAKLKRGDRVLIHAAAGGVGQAAVQIAQQAGAIVYATASPGKWDFLRSLRAAAPGGSLGVKHIMNSRSLDFADTIMQLTDGRGVDVVLNSLNGAFIEKSLSVLAIGGRFVEIGKIGIWTAEQMHAARSDVSYYPFDLLTVGQENPAVIRSMLKSLLPKFESGKLNPLPHTVFPIEQATDAFRYMAQAKHIGKVVITLPPLPPAQPIVTPNATYLITGGLGALGLKVAQGLVDRGATHLILVGRKSPSPEVQQTIAQMQSSGAEITIAQIDITQPEAIEQLLQPYQSNHPNPLRGIIHAAGILDDGTLKNLDWNRFTQVMAPKVEGAWNLHQASRSLSLDFFVCFSSIASLIGSPGQGSYAAANAWIDGLMQYRRQQGLPGLSINWGAWAESGMAARLNDRDRQRLTAQGMTLIPGDRGIELLQLLLRERSAQVGVLPIDWSVFLSRQIKIPPFLQAFSETSTQVSSIAASSTSEQADSLSDTVLSSYSLEQLQIHLQTELAKVLGFSTADAIGLSDNFADLGMDSLMAVEFGNRLQKTLNCKVSSSVLFDYATIAALSEYLLAQIPQNDSQNDRKIEQSIPPEVANPKTIKILESNNGFSEIKQMIAENHSNGVKTVDKSEQLITAAKQVNHAVSQIQLNGSAIELDSPSANGKDDIKSSQSNVQTNDELEATIESLPAEFYQFSQTPEYINLKNDLERVEKLGNPFFNIQDGIARDTTYINGRELISYATYNYIGMSGDPIVSAAAKAAIEQYGTSVSASRVVSGERPIHRQLEQAIARFLGTEDCIAYVGGHATNVTTIGHLFGDRDLILCDALSHNSIREGCKLSGSTVIEFVHNDVRSLEQQLIQHRHRYQKVLIVVEGIYSTDGDLAPLPEIVELKQRFKTFLMVDEAHSIGVLGRRGGGIGEHFNIVPQDVDLWMGTLSKSFASCGGYIAGCKELIEYLKYTAPGFVFSVGMSPPDTAAALAALQLLQQEPDRVTRLHRRSRLFLQLAKQNQLDTGDSHNSPVIPIIVGEPYKAVQLSHLLADRGIHVKPMVYPSVPYHRSRLRFFITSLHTEAQIQFTVDQLTDAIDHLQENP